MGGLFYPNQVLVPIVGTKNSANTRTSVALTDAYQADNGTNPTKTFDVGGFTRIEFAIAYTTGAAETNNNIDVKLEWSPDGTNFYQFTTDSTSGGTSTMTARDFTYVGASAATTYPITWGVDLAYKDVIRVSFKESNVAANAGSVFCEALLSGR